MPGPLLVFSEPGASFPFGMMGFTDFHAMLRSWPLSVKYSLLIIRANGSGIWVLKANQAQNRYATVVICNTNAVMLILWVIHIFFNSTIIAGKNLLLVSFFFHLKHKRSNLQSNNNYDFEMPQSKISIFISEHCWIKYVTWPYVTHCFSVWGKKGKNLSYWGGDKIWPFGSSKWYYIIKTHEGTLINQQRETEKSEMRLTF